MTKQDGLAKPINSLYLEQLAQLNPLESSVRIAA